MQRNTAFIEGDGNNRGILNEMLSEVKEKVNEINEKYSDILYPYFKNMTGKFGTGFGSASDEERKRAYAMAAALEPVQTAELNKLADEYERQTSEFQKAQDAHRDAYAKKYDSIRKEQEALRAKIAELEKQDPSTNNLMLLSRHIQIFFI